MEEDNAILKRLELVEKLTPKKGEGFNVVAVEEYASDIEDELELIGHFDTRAEADAMVTEMKEQDPEVIVYVYGEDEQAPEEPATNGLRKFINSL